MGTWKGLLCSSLLGVFAMACGDETPAPASSSAVCARICARSSAADCGHEPAGCEARCEDLTESTPAVCKSQLESLTDCLSSAQFSCDDDDQADAPSCAAKLTRWDSCVSAHGSTLSPTPTPSPTPVPPPSPMSSGDSANLCDEICLNSGLAHCALDTYCDGCAGLPKQTPVACGGALTAMLGCRAHAKYTCDATNDADTDGCLTEDHRFVACMQAHGAVPASGDDVPALCMPRSDDTSCAACQKEQCCEERGACEGDCKALVGCYEPCKDDACYEACDSAHPEGAEVLQALYECSAALCESECELGEPAPASDTSACLNIDVDEARYCAGTGKKVGRDCPSGSPDASCVVSPTGAGGVFCCDA